MANLNNLIKFRDFMLQLPEKRVDLAYFALTENSKHVYSLEEGDLFKKRLRSEENFSSDRAVVIHRLNRLIKYEQIANLIKLREYISLPGIAERVNLNTWCSTFSKFTQRLVNASDIPADIKRTLNTNHNSCGCMLGWTAVLFPQEADKAPTVGDLADEVYCLGYKTQNNLFHTLFKHELADGKLHWEIAVDRLNKMIEQLNNEDN